MGSAAPARRRLSRQSAEAHLGAPRYPAPLSIALQHIVSTVPLNSSEAPAPVSPRPGGGGGGVSWSAVAAAYGRGPRRAADQDGDALGRSDGQGWRLRPLLGVLLELLEQSAISGARGWGSLALLLIRAWEQPMCRVGSAVQRKDDQRSARWMPDRPATAPVDSRRRNSKTCGAVGVPPSEIEWIDAVASRSREVAVDWHQRTRARPSSESPVEGRPPSGRRWGSVVP